MRSTINGDDQSISCTRDTDIAIAILRYLQFHRPDDRGQQVLIYLEEDELFEGAVNRPDSPPTEKQVLEAMKELAQTVNAMWWEQIQDRPLFDEVNNLPLPDPRDIELEVVRGGYWNGQTFVSKCLAFQILTKPWLGARPFDGGYIHSDMWIAV